MTFTVRATFENDERDVAIYIMRQKHDLRPIDIYGIVTSGDIIQFHKLKEGRDIHSSPVFLLTEEGHPGVWSYLRHIIHAVQLMASPPPPKLRRPSGRNIPIYTPYHEMERKVMVEKWGFDPAGKVNLGDRPETNLDGDDNSSMEDNDGTPKRRIISDKPDHGRDALGPYRFEPESDSDDSASDSSDSDPEDSNSSSVACNSDFSSDIQLDKTGEFEMITFDELEGDH